MTLRRGSGAVSSESVFNRTVNEAVRRSQLRAANDPTFIGGGAFKAKGVGAVIRPISEKLQAVLDAADFGVAGDGLMDDTATAQLALDAGRDQHKVVNFRDLIVRITGPLTCDGPGFVFDAVSHGDSGGPGFLVDGGRYTAMTITGAPQAIAASFYGTGNTVDGVYLNNPQRAVVQHLRVFNLDGFGVQIDKCYDCVFETVSVEQCGNGTHYAFSMNDAGDTCNQSHITRLQVEKAKEKAIFISGSTLSCTFDSIHSEQASVSTVTAGAFVIGQQYRILSIGTTDYTLIGASGNTVGGIFTATGIGAGSGTAALAATWFLGGSRSSYRTGTFTAIAPDTNALLWLSGGQAEYSSFLVEGGIDVAFESHTSISIFNPEIQGTAHVLTNQLGLVDIFGGKIASMPTDANFIRCYATDIGTLTMGFSNNPADATRARFYGCKIAVLASNSTLSAATFSNCELAEGGNLLRGKTVLTDGTEVFCASTLAHSSGILEVHGSTINAAISYTNAAAIRGFGAIFNGGITRGDAGGINIVCDDGCVSIGTTSHADVPTAGAHTVGERHKNLVPASGGDLGWVCTASGTPGTWATLGAATLSHSLTAGTHLTGGPFDGSANVTLATDATDTNTGSTIMARDANGDYAARIANLRDAVLSGSLQLGNTYTATPPTATGFLTVKDAGGTTYKILVST